MYMNIDIRKSQCKDHDIGKILNINQRLIDTIAKMCTKDLQTSYKENQNLQKFT